MFVIPAPVSIYPFSSVRHSQYLTSIEQCADITFVAEPVFMITDCVNSTGVGGEAINQNPSPTNGTPSTTSVHPSVSSTAAAVKLTGSVMAAGILAMFGFIL